MRVKVVYSKGGLQELAKAARKARLEAVAGVLRGATNSDTGESVAAYGLALEYGTSKMPARPFLRQTVEGHKKEWREQLAMGVKHRGLRRAEEVLGVVGRVMRADIVATIKRGDFAPLSPETIEAKERKRRENPAAPLIDTTSLIRSISSEVRKV